jgi:pimeloyl-ACP methyl ester carboxylesterase
MTDSERIEFRHSDGVTTSISQPSSGRASLQLPPYEPGNFGGPSSDGLGMSKVYPGWQSRDPRTSSTQSLLPSLNEDERRRTLLIVYIHGFMGNDSSFRSFPAHVHSYLKETLQETHVVHSKIYPRYKTYKAIDVARDNFSKWLEPHESPKTDIVLIGHSMGGLLAADIVLIVRVLPNV